MTRTLYCLAYHELGDWTRSANVGVHTRTKTQLHVWWQHAPPPIYKHKRIPHAPRTCGVVWVAPVSGKPLFLNYQGRGDRDPGDDLPV